MKSEKSCGAVVYMSYNDTIEFLAVRSKVHSHWGFPKGHVQEGESEQETAKREVLEETGLVITLCEDFRTSVEYLPVEDTCKEVVFFIGQALSQYVNIDQREIQDYKWFNYNKMLELLTFDNDKKILSEAKNYIDNKDF